MKTDTKALTLAYFGCIVLSIATIIYTNARGDSTIYLALLCVCLGIIGGFIVRDSEYFGYAFGKIWRNLKR